MTVACGLRGPRDSYPMQFLLPYFSTYFSILSHTSIFLPRPRFHIVVFLQFSSSHSKADDDSCATFEDFDNNVDKNILSHTSIFLPRPRFHIFVDLQFSSTHSKAEALDDDSCVTLMILV